MAENNTAFYSPIVSWEVWNFMSIEHGVAEFDDKNIVNFKGYNDSGKSAMLTALKVATTNANASKQVSFIQDDKEYFRVLITFADGVRILRDKYINGQSLYEMYKGDDLLYTSKSSSGSLTKISEVPKPIADYLGLIVHDGSCLNARSCFEKQLGVQTTGSENYKMFNTILKSEELSKASEILNNDKNRLLSDINSNENVLRAKQDLVKDIIGLTSELITALKESDAVVDNLTSQADLIQGMTQLRENISAIPTIPELPTTVLDELNILCQLGNLKASIDSIQIAPQVQGIDIAQLSALEEIKNVVDELATIEVYPLCTAIDTAQLQLLTQIEGIVTQITDLEANITNLDESLNTYNEELNVLNAQMKELGAKMVKCPHCGTLFNAEENAEHIH